MRKNNRPLSPHLQIYKPQLTSVLSITHRLTGISLVVMIFGVVAWLLAAACGPESLAYVQRWNTYPMGTLIGLLSLFISFYHFFNGIRHLVWDAGRGLELKHVYQSGWTVVLLSIGFTYVYWNYL